MPNSKKINDQQVLEGKVYAILSYLMVLCIIPLVLKKDNSFVLFHGKQGLVIFVGEVAVFILSIPLSFLLWPGLFVLLAVSFWGIIEVLQGRYTRLPGIADIADKITL